MPEETALIVAEQLNPAEVFNGGMPAILEQIKNQVDAIVPDVSTEAGRQEIKSTAYKISRSKTLLDGMGKELVSEWKKKAKGIDAVRKDARDFLDNLKAEFRQPLTDWEAAEQKKEEERIAGVKEKLEHLESLTVNYHECTVERIQEVIGIIEGTKVDPEVFYEFTVEANEIKTNRLNWAHEQLEKRKEFDRQEAERRDEAERLAKERKELERLRKEQEAREAEERAKREAEEAELKEQQEQVEAEKRAIEEEKRKIEERQRLEEAKAKAAEEARLAEIERQKQAEREKAEAEKRRKEEELRQEMLRPDKDKLIVFAQFLGEEIIYPEVNDENADKIVQEAYRKIEAISKFVFHEAQSL